MFFEQIVREDLGCAAYVVGSTDAGECIVVDPRLDEVDEILALAARKGMRVVGIVETHNHADHVAGHTELAGRTGAPIYVHEAADVEYEHISLHDGDVLRAGEISVRVLHTPGHRPEHIALAVADTSRGDDPWLVLTGDSLFIGDVARPDLAVDGTDGARALYHSLFEALLPLGDGVEVYPGHVSGSLCGRAMNLKTSSTIGYERRHNAALQPVSQDEFISDMNRNLPERPPNMERIVAVNRGTAPLDRSEPRLLTPEAFDAARPGSVVLDVRAPGEFGARHVPGSINVDLHGPQFGTRVGFVVPPGTPLLLVLARDEDLAGALEALAVVGYTQVVGALAGGVAAWQEQGLATQSVPQITVEEARELLSRVTVLDVREQGEWQDGHIEGAFHIPFHALAKRVEELPGGRPVAVICGSGQRSSIAGSILQANGVPDVMNVQGGMGAWMASGYPVAREELLPVG